MNETEKTEIPEIIKIPVSLFEKQSNKTTQLVNNANPDFTMDGKWRWYEFELKENIFVKQIAILADGYGVFDNLTFEYKCSDGTAETLQVKQTDGQFVLQMGRLISSFRFRPNANFNLLSKQTIKKVEVNGYTLEQFFTFENFVADYEELVTSLNKRETDLTARMSKAEERLGFINSEVDRLHQEKTSLDSELGKSRAEADELKKQISADETQIKKLSNDLKDIQSDIDNENEKRRSLQSSISKQSLELNRLQSELKLFPSEIADFVKEGNRSISLYVILAIPFTGVIIWVTSALFSSAIDLTQLWKKDDVDIWTVFLTRLPFVLVAVAILEVCAYLIGQFIFEILKLNRQRLNLSKLSIVAKDVTEASANNTELSDDEKFHLQTQLKMELLKDHLREYISEEFTYKGTSLQQAIGSVFKKTSNSQSNTD